MNRRKPAKNGNARRRECMMGQPVSGLSTARRPIVCGPRAALAPFTAFGIVRSAPVVRRRAARTTSATRPTGYGRRHCEAGSWYSAPIVVRKSAAGIVAGDRDQFAQRRTPVCRRPSAVGLAPAASSRSASAVEPARSGSPLTGRRPAGQVPGGCLKCAHAGPIMRSSGGVRDGTNFAMGRRSRAIPRKRNF